MLSVFLKKKPYWTNYKVTVLGIKRVSYGGLFSNGRDAVVKDAMLRQRKCFKRFISKLFLIRP